MKLIDLLIVISDSHDNVYGAVIRPLPLQEFHPVHNHMINVAWATECATWLEPQLAAMILHSPNIATKDFALRIWKVYLEIRKESPQSKV